MPKDNNLSIASFFQQRPLSLNKLTNSAEICSWFVSTKSLTNLDCFTHLYTDTMTTLTNLILTCLDSLLPPFSGRSPSVLLLKSISTSVLHLVRATLAKDAATSGRQEFLFARSRVCDLLSKLLRMPSHLRLLAVVDGVLTGHYTLSCKIQLDVIQSFVCVETDLDAASTSADSLHVVFVQSSRNDVFGARHFLHPNQVCMLRQVLKHKIDDLHFSWLTHSVVCRERGLSGDRIVAG